MRASVYSLSSPQALTLWAVRGSVCDDDPTGGAGWAVDRAAALPAALKALLAAPEKDEENGYWIVEGFGAAADNVQTYSYGKVFRPADEVFAPESIEGWRGLPVIVHHPTRRGERKPLLNTENASDHQRGSVIDVVPLPEHNLVKVRLRLTGQEAIDAIDKRGLVALSLGYWRDLTPEAGTAPDGTAYQWTCRNIKPNHLAIVDHARAGALARVATDATSTPLGDRMYWLIPRPRFGSPRRV